MNGKTSEFLLKPCEKTLDFSSLLKIRHNTNRSSRTLKGEVMESSNPVLKRGFAQMDRSQLESDSLEATFSAPAASSMRTGRMTMDDVVVRTSLLFLVLAASAAFAWVANLTALVLPAVLIALVLGLVISLSQKVRVGAILAYAALEGIAIGAISKVFEQSYPGIVSQAVMATFAAFGGMLFAYKSGKIRVTPRFSKVMMGSLIGYLIMGIVFMFVGFPTGGLGLLIAFGGVALASFFFVLDFDQIDRLIAAGAPEQESWRAGFGLMVTMVWLYLEVLRLLSMLRDRD